MTERLSTHPRTLEEGRTPTNSDDGTERDASTDQKSIWDTIKKVTFTGTMTSAFTSYAVPNKNFLAGAFAAFSLYKAESALDAYPEDLRSVKVNLANAVGNALWSGGIAGDSRIVQGVGPALNCIVNGVSAALKFKENNKGWRRETLEFTEMGLFAIANGTKIPGIRAMAFVNFGAGFLWDAKQDKGLIGHGAGALMWALGAVLESDRWQAAGSGTLALSEAGRLAYPTLEPIIKEYVAKYWTESAPQHTGSDPAPLANSTVTASHSPVASPSPCMASIASMVPNAVASCSSPSVASHPSAATASVRASSAPQSLITPGAAQQFGPPNSGHRRHSVTADGRPDLSRTSATRASTPATAPRRRRHSMG